LVLFSFVKLWITLTHKLRALLVVRDRLLKAKVQFEVPIKESSEFIGKSIRHLVIANCKTTTQAIAKDIKRVDVEILR
jgi:hypothetical protein